MAIEVKATIKGDCGSVHASVQEWSQCVECDHRRAAYNAYMEPNPYTIPRLLRRSLWEDSQGILYVIEVWRELGLTTKVIRRA